MAQHPNKMRWRSTIPHGLSASQFGMALGFCGKVSDYVDYERNVVGTRLEFVGNPCTEHGIRTEPKSRALYEMLTGCRVRSGGFFISHDGLLGCSPDGRIFIDESEESCSTSCKRRRLSSSSWIQEENRSFSMSVQRSPKGDFSFKIPFSKKKVEKDLLSSMAATTSGFPPSRSEEFTKLLYWAQKQRNSERRSKKVRLLEIKSPFRSLYSGKGEHCHPFGIPLHYMCQIQGQMAIADAEECDFFVFVESSGQVEAWRVERSAAFWEWAEPKLLQVTTWLRDGPPDWLNRSFEFDHFDFSVVNVKPLVFPFSIALCTSLESKVSFPFFSQFKSPYDRIREVTLDHLPTSELDGIAAMLFSPVVKALFSPQEGAAGSAAVWHFEVVEAEKFISALLSISSVVSWLTEEEKESVSHHNRVVRVEVIDMDAGSILMTLLGENEHTTFDFMLHFFDRDVFRFLTSPMLFTGAAVTKELSI